MCVQNDMLTIAGEVRVQTGTHPNPLPKTLTGPNLQRFRLIQTCRGMRGFTDFCLCSTRAKFAPVSAHLSICRNFTTALPRRSSQGRHSMQRLRASGPGSACMHVQARLSRRSKARSRSENPRPNGPAGRRSRRFHGPGAHCTAHRNRSVPKILTSPARNSVTRIPPNPRQTRDRPPESPEKPHLIEKSGAMTDANATPEKPHRNRRGIKKINGIRYLGAAGNLLCSSGTPRKTSPFPGPDERNSCVATPEKSHLCQKVAQQKSDFCQSRRAFRGILAHAGPEKPHL